MSRPIIQIHNTETDEIIIREMNADEFAQYQKDNAEYSKMKAEAETRALAKSALLDKLGITEDEARLLLN